MVECAKVSLEGLILILRVPHDGTCLHCEHSLRLENVNIGYLQRWILLRGNRMSWFLSYHLFAVGSFDTAGSLNLLCRRWKSLIRVLVRSSFAWLQLFKSIYDQLSRLARVWVLRAEDLRHTDREKWVLWFHLALLSIITLHKLIEHP